MIELTPVQLEVELTPQELGASDEIYHLIAGQRDNLENLTFVYSDFSGIYKKHEVQLPINRIKVFGNVNRRLFENHGIQYFNSTHKYKTQPGE